MIENLEEKLKGKLPVTRIELFELVSSWGRTEHFYTYDNIKNKKCDSNECYDLSNLDVSQINNLSDVFCYSPYNGDLSKWNTSSCKNMSSMFNNSEFNNDSLNYWDISKVEKMYHIFYKSKFNGDISDWDISNVIDIDYAFARSKFDGDTNEFKKKIAFLFKFFNEIFVSLKQCGLNYVISNRFSLLESLIN